MDFGILTAKVDEIGYIVHAENLGFTHCWVTDSPMIRSNCWAVLALAAERTRTIKLGTGVAVPGLRLAPVAANGIATINRLAPGRCFMALGTGNTGMRMLGHKPMKLAPFAEYVRVVRSLLRGEEVDFTLNGETHPIRFQMREHRFIDLEHPIPLYLSGFGPKAQALAGELAEGLVSSLRYGATLAQILANARRGAERAGRTLAQDFYFTAMQPVVLLQPGESPVCERVLAECGASVVTNLHQLVAEYLDTGKEPPEYVRPVWKAYLDWLEGFAPAVRHQRLHGSHFSFLDPQEARFITPELVKASSLVGSAAELIEELRELEREGVRQITLYPPLNRQYRVIEDFAEQVISRM
ncbi:MAG: LLM class flavin-dependent oxidoreductase [Burkholderiales bacterium]|nr:LLM class flavin-dependent oxidoreductase [Burkholderiales bacterium]